MKRYAAIWFRYLASDWIALRKPALRAIPFVIALPDHGRLKITASNILAEKKGIYPGMVVADAKAIIPELEVIDAIPGLNERLLKTIGKWCIRFSPVISADPPDGIILDISGCPHLWGGERDYLKEIILRLKSKGYHVRAAIADTIGTAWAVSRFGKETAIIPPGEHASALLSLPPAALRLEQPILEKLRKLGFKSIDSFINVPGSVLRRRFGTGLLQRLDQALGEEEEYRMPIVPVEAYQERLPCLEPIRTPTGIEIALQKLLEMLCSRLHKEGKGVRKAVFKGYRIDGKMVRMSIGTNRPTHYIPHLFKLFELKISTIEPASGIDLFVLEASQVEDITLAQETIWANNNNGLEDQNLSELLDRIAGKVGANAIRRYLPEEHYWPERSVRIASSLRDRPSTSWRTDKPRPVQLLNKPQPVEVTAPIPDYPPMLFRYKDKIHKIKRADGPERIEREWWMDAGTHRDYYQVEDENGGRYWLFRSGHYSDDQSQWFIHGFFA